MTGRWGGGAGHSAIHSPAPPPELLVDALAAAERGWSVLPLVPRGKAPLGRLVSRGVKDATTDPDRIRKWWRREPEANVGVATGGGLVVVDIDEGGEKSVRQLEANHGPLPPTVESVTGRGRHLFLRVDPGQRVPCSAGKLGAGLDVRGDGGYIVAPGSVHPSGAIYEWRTAPDEAPLAPLPAKWLELLVAERAASNVIQFPSRPETGGGYLESLTPPDYIGFLLGRNVDAWRHIACPFHDDSTPSLMVYPDPGFGQKGQGWWCYGCERGGGIYHFAAYLLGVRVPLSAENKEAVALALVDVFRKRTEAAS